METAIFKGVDQSFIFTDIQKRILNKGFKVISITFSELTNSTYEAIVCYI